MSFNVVAQSCCLSSQHYLTLGQTMAKESGSMSTEICTCRPEGSEVGAVESLTNQVPSMLVMESFYRLPENTTNLNKSSFAAQNFMTGYCYNWNIPPSVRSPDMPQADLAIYNPLPAGIDMCDTNDGGGWTYSKSKQKLNPEAKEYIPIGSRTGNESTVEHDKNIYNLGIDEPHCNLMHSMGLNIEINHNSSSKDKLQPDISKPTESIDSKSTEESHISSLFEENKTGVTSRLALKMEATQSCDNEDPLVLHGNTNLSVLSDEGDCLITRERHYSESSVCSSDSFVIEFDACCGEQEGNVLEIPGGSLFRSCSGNDCIGSEDDEDSSSMEGDTDDDEAWDESDYDCSLFCIEEDFPCGGLMIENLLTSVSNEAINSGVDDEEIDKTFLQVLIDANTKWNELIDQDCKKNTPAKISFNPDVTINELDDADECRKSPWLEELLHRMRVKRENEKKIGWIFNPDHRRKMSLYIKSAATK